MDWEQALAVPETYIEDEYEGDDEEDPTWLNLVFNVAADFGEGFVQVLG